MLRRTQKLVKTTIEAIGVDLAVWLALKELWLKQSVRESTFKAAKWRSNKNSLFVHKAQEDSTMLPEEEGLSCDSIEKCGRETGYFFTLRHFDSLVWHD